MLNHIEIVNPMEIEKKSFEKITELLGDRTFPALHAPVIKRVIHTTADFEFADLVKISEGAVEKAIEAIKGGCCIVTDTKMAAAGINKKALAKWGGSVVCMMDDEAVAEEAKRRNVTRASICMEKLAVDEKNKIFAIGNAPTALIRLYELVAEGSCRPEVVVGVPVGFVNVVESKELFMTSGVPYIITQGRKGGSNIAAAIINAILILAGS